MGAGASTGNPGGGAPANAGAAAPPPARRSGKSSSIGAKLALAAKEGDKEKVETLLGMAGSDPNAIDPATGNTALHFAAAMGHEDMVSTLLMYDGLELSAENFHHTTALVLAAGNGHVKIIDALLADPRCDPNFMTSGGVGALHMAAQRGRLLSVRSLLRHPATDPNRPNPPAQGGDTPLHIAARTGKSKVVRALLADDRINTSVLNSTGTSPAAAAKDAGQDEMVELILQRAPSGYEGMSSADAGPYDPFRGAKFRGTEIKYPEQAPAPPEGGFRLPAPGEEGEREYEGHTAGGASTLENQAPAHSASFRQGRAEPAHDEGWQNVPGLNFHGGGSGGSGPTASGRWQGSERERRDSMDSESASASGSVQRLAAERKGFFGRMRDKLDETNEASAARAKEKAEMAEKKRLAAEDLKRDMMERKLAEAAAKKLRDAEDDARKEAVLRSKKEAEGLKKEEAEKKKKEEALKKQRTAEEKKAAEDQKKADANRKAWEARQRKEYEERAKKNAAERQQRNGTGGAAGASQQQQQQQQQAPPKAAAGGSFFSSKPSAAATKKLWVNHDAAWEAFDANPPAVIAYSKVPWPPDEDDVLRGMVLASTEQGHKDDVAKKVYRKATLRWHPDKFVGKFGKLMAPADEESIMNNVKNISQGINRSWQIASY